MPEGGTDRSDRPDNHVSVFPYPGGKGRKADWILEKVPPHDTFVDVFGGSGAVIYNKPPSTNEIYNDLNGDLVQFFQVLREREGELSEWVRNIPYSRAVYNEWVTDYFDGERPEDPVERAGRFFFLRYAQFAGDISMKNGFKVRAKRSPARTFDNARYRLEELAERFRDAIIENRDYQRIFSTYDDTDIDVLYYCDPPYVGGEGYYPGEFSHEEFAEALLTLESDWMVSYSELPGSLVAKMMGEVRENGREFHVLQRSRRHRMCRGATDSTEHLVCSFDPAERSQFIENGEQQTLVTATDGGGTAGKSDTGVDRRGGGS